MRGSEVKSGVVGGYKEFASTMSGDDVTDERGFGKFVTEEANSEGPDISNKYTRSIGLSIPH